MVTTLEPTHRIRRRRDALCAEVGGEVVIMDADRGVYYGLDPVGSDIWHRLAEPITPARLVADLIDAYEGDRCTIETQTLALLERLVEKGLVDRLPEAA